MLTGLWSAASGMGAGSRMLDALAVDLANVNTPGYKRNVLQFAESAEEAQYRAGRTAGPAGVTSAADWVRMGYGVSEASAVRDFAQGTILDTGQPLDLAIQGKGFFALQNPDGSKGYTRSGAFRADANGQLVDPAGRLLLGDKGTAITLPKGALDVSISGDGTVTARVTGPTGADQLQTVARIGVAYTEAPETLLPDSGVFTAPDSASAPAIGGPGEGGRGTLRQGALESANVDLASAMVGLIIAQRAYTMSARAFSGADQMWNEANTLYG